MKNNCSNNGKITASTEIVSICESKWLSTFNQAVKLKTMKSVHFFPLYTTCFVGAQQTEAVEGIDFEWKGTTKFS